MLRKYICLCIRLLIKKNRSHDGVTETQKPEPRRYVNYIMHDVGLNIRATFYCTKYGNKQKFLCVRWGSGPCIIPGMQRPERETSHSSPSRFEVRMDIAVPLPALFWVYTQRVVVISYRNFWTTYRSHRQGSQEILKRKRRSHPHGSGSLKPLMSKSTFSSSYFNTITHKHNSQPSIGAIS